MSLSSATTLISPSNGRPAAHPATGGGIARRASTHGHPVKRRGSTHGHAHGHGHNRRGSEGEQGRRAMVAGLAMHTMDGPAQKGKKRGDRPLTKSSRSDTHLPRLSRTNSMISVQSHSSAQSNTSRPGGRTRRSEEEVQTLDENGQPVDADEEGWESGEEEKKGKAAKSQKKREHRASSAAMRRTVSDTSADPKGHRAGQPSISEMLAKGDLADVPDPDHPPPLTQRTTGFAGTVQPPDPQVAAELPPTEPPAIVHTPLKRVASSKSLVGPISMEHTPTTPGDEGIATEPPKAVKDAKKRAEASAPSSLAMRSTSGSGLPQKANRDEAKAKVSTSPSYPFPHMPTPAASNKPSPTGPSQDSPTSSQPPAPASESSEPRSRHTSHNQPRTLRHRPSNSSIRSIQSLRAPPHPLNSPTGYRTVGRGGAHDSPSKANGGTSYDKRARVPSMHQPPVPSPQISYEVAQGKGYDTIPETGAASTAGGLSASPVDSTAGQMGTTGAGGSTEASSHTLRRSSVASTRSVRSIFAGTLLANPAPTATTTSSAHPGPPTRRLTAMEAAAAASKRQTTNNPTLYHTSLGHPSNVADTTYLTSRFLPVRKVRRPAWEIDMNDAERIESGGVGLTNGDYRESHESLVRTFRELGAGGNGSEPQKRGVSRSYSGYGLLPSSLSSVASAASAAAGAMTEGTGVKGLGTIKARDGARFEVGRGGSRGMTPFEMSVERVMAQKPRRVGM
ncbi:hypothetical protein IAT38_004501 [Cryptococcus sp. DSM 104549]